MSINLSVTDQPHNSRQFSNRQFLWAMDALGINYIEGITSALEPRQMQSAINRFWQDWGYASPEEWNELLARRQSPSTQKVLNFLGGTAIPEKDKSDLELRNDLGDLIRHIGWLTKHAIRANSTLSLF